MNETTTLVVSTLRCLLSHAWGEPEKEIIKSTGFNVLFFTSGVQKAVRQCARCGRSQKVWRSGFCGIGGKSGRWRRLRASKEKWIDSLPNL